MGGEVSDLNSAIGNTSTPEMVTGFYIHNLNGGRIQNSAYAYCEYFPVNPGDKIRLNNIAIYGSQGTSFYDANKQYVDYLHSDVNGGNLSIETTIPNGVYYLQSTALANNIITVDFFNIFDTYIKKNENSIKEIKTDITEFEIDINLLKNGYETFNKLTVDWIRGSITNTGVVATSVLYRIVTNNIINVTETTRLYISPGYKFFVAYYTDSGETFDRSSAWITDSIEISAGSYIRLCITINPEQTSIVADVDTFRKQIYYQTVFYNEIKELEDDVDQLIGEAIPAYWESEIASKVDVINVNNCDLGQHGDSFVFMTDYHMNTSNNMSRRLIDYIEKHTSVVKFFYGGDTTDGGGLTTPQMAINKIRSFEEMFRGLNMFPIRGNHDEEPTANQTVNQIPDGAFYDVFLRSIENGINTNGNLYYTVDNDSQKIRYIMMDSGGMNNPLNSTQLNWLKAKIIELESDWSCVVIQHIIGEQDAGNRRVLVSTRGAYTINAINEALQTAVCTFICVIAGHVHTDYIDTTTASYPIIYTTCDSGGANAAYDFDNPVRTAGTITECAFDVFSIDTSNRTIKITRVGAGSNRAISY